MRLGSFWVSSLLTVLCTASLAKSAHSVMHASTAVDSAGTIGGVEFLRAHIQPSDLGRINSILHIRMDRSEQNYSADKWPESREQNGNLIHSTPIKDIPVVQIDESDYRESLIEINQTPSGSDSALARDQYPIWREAIGDLTAHASDPSKLIHDAAAPRHHLSMFDAGPNRASYSAHRISHDPDDLFIALNSYLDLSSRLDERNPSIPDSEERAVRES